jgi:hypothetical protein
VLVVVSVGGFVEGAVGLKDCEIFEIVVKNKNEIFIL